MTVTCRELTSFHIVYSVILGCSSSYGCLGEGAVGVSEGGVQPQDIFEVYFGKLPRLQ